VKKDEYEEDVFVGYDHAQKWRSSSKCLDLECIRGLVVRRTAPMFYESSFGVANCEV